jgi:3-oxoacyl-[acyl-carrier protein] reductase
MNRIVMNSGSTRGIGFETATEFLKYNDKVVIFCRHKNHVKNTVKELSRMAAGKNILGLVGDVRQGKDLRRIVGQCLKRFARIDVLINNAGISAYKPIEETTEKEWNDIVDTNLKGPFLFMKEVIPIMKKQGSGVIINISSGLGVEGEANFSAYCASKFGLVGLTQVVADETADTGIRVYAVLPGAVNTSLISDMGLERNLSDLLAPEYVAKRILRVAEGKKKSGELVEVYS